MYIYIYIYIYICVYCTSARPSLPPIKKCGSVSDKKVASHHMLLAKCFQKSSDFRKGKMMLPACSLNSVCTRQKLSLLGSKLDSLLRQKLGFRTRIDSRPFNPSC